MKNIKIWFDITNTPQVHFLHGIKKILENDYNDFTFSAREFSETTKLLKDKINDDFIIFGGHAGKNKLSKALNLIKRFTQIFKAKIDYDLSISCGSENAIWTSKLKRKKSIAFGDNDLAKQWTYGRFVDYAFFPNAISEEILTKQGINRKRLYRYDGYKEDIYIADYKPDKNFLEKLPFDNYVVLRPENINANYVKGHSPTIVPELSKMLLSKGIKIVYLPRYKSDSKYVASHPNVFIPPTPLNGLDLCFYSDGVFTGAGTLAREAACLNIPSFSFFAGERLLAVDKKLVDEGRIYFSRDPNSIMQVFLKSSKTQPDLTRCKVVKDEVGIKLKEVIKHLFN